MAAARLAVFPEPFEHLAVYEYNEGLVSHSVYLMFGDHEGTTELQKNNFRLLRSVIEDSQLRVKMDFLSLRNQL